jgi:hypothetical protein
VEYLNSVFIFFAGLMAVLLAAPSAVGDIDVAVCIDCRVRDRIQVARQSLCDLVVKRLARVHQLDRKLHRFSLKAASDRFLHR